MPNKFDSAFNKFDSAFNLTGAAMNNIENKIFSIISKEFDVQPSEIDRTVVAEDIDGWDSLKHSIIIARLEIEFDIIIETEEIDTISNVGSLIDLIKSKFP